MRQVIRVLKTPVTLIILLAILGYGAVWGYNQVTLPANRKEASCVAVDVGGKLTPDRVTVRVLNGGTQGGLAKTTAFRLRQKGFHVVFWNNSDERVPNPVVVGSSADDPEVRLLQQFFTDATTKGDGRGDHVVDVILTDQDSFIKDAVGSIPVTGPVCLPAIVTASESPIPTVTPSATPSKKK